MIELLDEAAPDAEDFVVCWLQPLLLAAVLRDSDDPFPFAGVQRVAGGDDENEGLDEPIIQVDILDEGVVAASRTARLVDRRMKLLSRTQPDVTMSDGRVANAEWCDTIQKPIRMPYASESVTRYVARYRLGLSYVTV